MKKNILGLLGGIIMCGSLFAGFKTKEAPIMTKWAKDVDINCPHPEYPRPQMERKEWMNLNGIWQFQKGGSEDAVPVGKDLSGKILVPFAVESALSGVMEYMDRLWYRRSFEIPSNWNGKKIILHFGAVDYESEVFVNGKSFGVHRGGYLPFSYDITDALKDGENELIVRVYDPTDKGGQPRGKQDTKPQGIMYTPTTGIWQTVWLEPVKQWHVKDIKIDTNIDTGEVFVTVFAGAYKGIVEVKIFESADEINPVATARGAENKPIKLKLAKPKLWSSNDPHLYGLEVVLLGTRNLRTVSEELVKPQNPKDVVHFDDLSEEEQRNLSESVTEAHSFEEDSVRSYFGMRKILVENVDGHVKIMLNNKPIFMNGLLDQGYWPDGILTAPTDEALRYDIEKTLEYGYNFTRKHIKVEPARWYYWADKLGLMVWQDAPSCNSYNGHHEHKPAIDKQAFEDGLVGMVDFLKNSPAVVMWVIFNESQGQFDTERMVGIVEKLDPTRLINEASDGILVGGGHIKDIHHYPAPRSPEPNGRQAIVCGEFGGIGMKVPGHMWEEKGSGYTNVNTPEDLLFKYADFYDMVRKMRDEKGLAAVVYTQITDVMTEINGIMTYDRIDKVRPADLRKINEFKFKMPDFKPLLPTSEKEPQKWMYSTSHIGAWQMPKTEDDSAFKEALAPFGEASGIKGNTEWKTPDIWIRKTFRVGDIPQGEIDRLMMRLMHDENFIVFINGVEAVQKGGFITGYEYYPIAQKALDTIKPNSENTIAVFCTNKEGGQFIDVGIYIRGEIEYAE